MNQTEYHLQNKIFSRADVYEKIKRLADFESHQKYKILDVGSGSGLLGARLRSLGHAVTELDIQPRENQPHFIRCDISRTWPVGDQKFNFIICTDVPEHLYDPAHVLRESARVLSAGGFLIFGVPNHFDLRQRIYQFLGKGIVHWDQKERFREQVWNYSHIRFFTLPELYQFFQTHGWHPHKQQFNFMGGGIVPSRLLPGFVKISLLKMWPNLFSGKFIFLVRPAALGHQNTQTIYIPHTPAGL